MTGELEIGDALVEVDKGIAEVVKRLNEFGFRTFSSCSGLREDHQTQKSDGQILYVDVAGKCLDLIEIAEVSGWDWCLNGKAYYGKDGRPYFICELFKQ
jgi:hypothetical protein